MSIRDGILLLQIIKKTGEKIKKLYNSNKFCDILHVERGITAVTGSGGKTSLIGKLCSELTGKGSVLFTTTTHILRPVDIPVTDSAAETEAAFARLKAEGARPLVCAGRCSADNPRKLSAPTASMDELAALADYVLVEADGSKMLPIKAHRDYEPVIPKGSNSVILVVGLSGIGGKVSEKVHRVEEFGALTGALADDTVTTASVAKGIAAELGIYVGYNLKIYLNQTDIPGGRKLAEELADKLARAVSERGVVMPENSIYAGSLTEGYIYGL